jgi:hypothetical protein
LHFGDWQLLSRCFFLLSGSVSLGQNRVKPSSRADKKRTKESVENFSRITGFGAKSPQDYPIGEKLLDALAGSARPRVTLAPTRRRWLAGPASFRRRHS